MLLHRGPLSAGGLALELAVAHALVRRASGGEIDGALRIYQPTAPVVVFGRREVRHERFHQAVETAREAGFEPAIRAAGGRAVAYTAEAVVVDQVVREEHPGRNLEQRFEQFGLLFVEAFRQLGIDARLGAVPGEYCPGAHSVNSRGTVKLVGTAQRVVRDAWLFSSLVVVGDEARIRPVLTDVYRQLGTDFDDDSVGSLRAEEPAIKVADVEAALISAYGVEGVPAMPLDVRTIELAHELVERHRA